MARRSDYSNMQHRFDVSNLLLEAAHKRGKAYPGMFAADTAPDLRRGEMYEGMAESPELHTVTTAGGTPIRRQDAMGRWYFMPVIVSCSLGDIELSCAAISISGEKRIVQTALVGRRGTVNELVNVDSYKVSITASLIGEDGNYPEKDVQRMREVWELNEAVMLISALTDLVVGGEDKFVFDKIEFPTMGGTEHVQIVKFTAHSDAAVELIIEK